jgi:hypothetical protein
MTQILIPKFTPQHDISYALEEACRKRLTQIMEMKKRKARYYILIVMKGGPDGILTWKFILSDVKPPRMIGTVCYRVDNLKGELFREWVLPADVPLQDSCVSDIVDNKGGRLSSHEILDDAKNLPIIYG